MVMKESGVAYNGVSQENLKESPKEENNNDSTNFGRIVDKRSRVLFPVTFLIFNLCYWIYYIYGPK